MNWYYGVAGEQKGPVAEEELVGLRKAGSITDGTLVWREGMANWQPFKEMFPGNVVAAEVPPPLRLAASPAVLSTGNVICRECGGSFPKDEVLHFDNATVCANCKPIYLQRMREGVSGSEMEAIRNEHIKHEASVKSVGILYLIGGAASLGLGVMAAVGVGFAPGGTGADAGLAVGLTAVFVVLGAFQIAAGLALRRLRSWARVAAGILSGIGLLGFPFGTLINGYILYLLFSKKGQMVFSEEYQRIIEQTPHVKYRTSIIVWIFLGILLLLILLGLMGALFANVR